MSAEPTRVAVYIDWQNCYKSCRRAFGMDALPGENGQFSPYQLGRILAAGNGRGASGAKLVRVQIHRGLPSQKHDHLGYSANRRQSAAWMKENPEVVIPRLRPLRYPWDPNEPPVEKGVDVEFALSAVEHVLTDLCQVAIIFTHDTDLLPVVETLVRLKNAECVETASWVSDIHETRLRSKAGRVFHHDVSEAVYTRVCDLTNYAYVGPKPQREGES